MHNTHVDIVLEELIDSTMENRTDLVRNIEELKKERNAVILVHNYQPPKIHEIADILGDSLELSQKASTTEADVIVFCGVKFMAETASILSPDKTVLLPDDTAGCPMADMITAEELRNMKKQYPGSLVVSYVNSTAETKTETDYCCTSGNALKVIEKIKELGKDIIFVPDKNLGGFISRTTDTPMHFWEGYCPIHDRFTADDITTLKVQYPDAQVMVHPECPKEVSDLADQVISTGRMVSWPGETDAKEIIVGTEVGMLYRLQKTYPHKTFIPANENAVCEDMKKITLEKVHAALETMSPEIKVPEDIRIKALAPLERMLAIV